MPSKHLISSFISSMPVDPRKLVDFRRLCAPPKSWTASPVAAKSHDIHSHFKTTTHVGKTILKKENTWPQPEKGAMNIYKPFPVMALWHCFTIYESMAKSAKFIPESHAKSAASLASKRLSTAALKSRTFRKNSAARGKSFNLRASWPHS